MMFDELSNSQTLLSSEQKRWTEHWWERFIWYVTLDELSNSQALLPSERKRWTEQLLEIFIWHVNLNELGNWYALLGSEQKRWTELWLEIFIWHVMFDKLSNSQALLPSEKKRSTKISEMYSPAMLWWFMWTVFIFNWKLLQYAKRLLCANVMIITVNSENYIFHSACFYHG
jgi:hypothetical protein